MNDVVSNTLRFEDYESLAKRIAARLLRKAQIAGNPTVDKNTIYSDVCYTWVKCRDNYNPEFGVSFGSYFYTSAMKNYGMFTRDRYDEVQAKSDSIDSLIADDDDRSHHDVNPALIDHSIDTESLVSRRQRLRRLGGKFPVLTTILELIADPPEELQNELKAYKAQAEISDRLGYSVNPVPQMLTIDLLQKIFGFNWRHRLRLCGEIDDAIAYIS